MPEIKNWGHEELRIQQEPSFPNWYKGSYVLLAQPDALKTQIWTLLF